MYSFQLYKFNMTCFAYACIMIPEKYLQMVKYNFLITSLLLRQPSFILPLFHSIFLHTITKTADFCQTV